MLNKDEIKQLGIIIDNEDLGSYRAASYDLRIGGVIAIRSENSKLVEQTEFFLLPAQGMAEVVSLETVKVPDNVAGYASVMTRSARQGLLPPKYRHRRPWLRRTTLRHSGKLWKIGAKPQTRRSVS